MTTTSMVGLAVFIAIAWVLSNKRNIVNVRVLIWGLVLQLGLGVVVFRTGVGHGALSALNDAANAIIAAAAAGPTFVFGSLADTNASSKNGIGFLLFFHGLLSIIVISAMLQLLYHFGIMTWIVKLFARVFSKLMRISGVDAMAASANIIVGNETILTVRPFLNSMTKSEMCVLMTACMATISANVMGAYVSILGGVFPGIAGHLASASLLSAPAALLAAKLIWPESEYPKTMGVNIEPYIERTPNIVSAIMTGAEAGGKLLVGVAVLLMAVVGLLGIVELLVGVLGQEANHLFDWNFTWSVSGLLGFVFKPIAWLMGVPWEEAGYVGELLGMRVVATEVGAYMRLAELIGWHVVTPRTAAIATYALCGFAHIPAMAITAGGIAVLAPSRREELSVIAPRAFLAATLACLMTGCIAGIFADGNKLLLFGS